MAQLINVKREAPWIGIGVQGQWDDYREALHASQLDFEVEAKDAKVEIDQLAMWPGSQGGLVSYETVPGVQVNVAKGSNKILGCVSTQYGIIQNHDAFSLLEPFTAAGGVITNAGMTEQGLCFMVLRMRQSVILGDEYDFDVMCTNSFNGAFACGLLIVPTRIICQNMYRKLLGNNDSMLSVRHGRWAPDRIKAANNATGKMFTFQSAFQMELLKANDKRLTHHWIDNYILPMLFPYPKPGGPREQLSRERVNQMREEFMDVYYDAPDNLKFQGRAMGFVNAYYDYLSHRNPGKMMPGEWSHRRLSGLVSGDVVNTRAIKEAIC